MKYSHLLISVSLVCATASVYGMEGSKTKTAEEESLWARIGKFVMPSDSYVDRMLGPVVEKANEDEKPAAAKALKMMKEERVFSTVDEGLTWVMTVGGVLATWYGSNWAYACFVVPAVAKIVKGYAQKGHDAGDLNAEQWAAIKKWVIEKWKNGLRGKSEPLTLKKHE